MDLTPLALLVFAGLSMLTAGLGALGGLGGAVMLVPLLALTGTPASEAAPLGLVSVAAASIAAGGLQLDERTTNHRLGVTTEVAATIGATVGALVSGAVSDDLLTWVLAIVALGAGAALLRGGPDDGRSQPPVATIGEWPGQIGGVVPAGPGDREVQPGVTYRAQNLPGGLAVMGLSGVVAGLAGASGGFIKTPAAVQIMGIPMRVAAATTTFTVGVTAAAGLVVFAMQGRVDPQIAAAVTAGSLLGGRVGARLQSVLPPTHIRRGLGLVLMGIAALLVLR